MAAVNCIASTPFREKTITLALIRFVSMGTITVSQLTSFVLFAEQLAKDAELFAQHAGRKTIKMDDVILLGT